LAYLPNLSPHLHGFPLGDPYLLLDPGNLRRFRVLDLCLCYCGLLLLLLGGDIGGAFAGLGEVDKARGVGRARLSSRGAHGGDRELGWASNKRGYEGWYGEEGVWSCYCCLCGLYILDSKSNLSAPCPHTSPPIGDTTALSRHVAWLKQMCTLSWLLMTAGAHGGAGPQALDPKR